MTSLYVSFWRDSEVSDCGQYVRFLRYTGPVWHAGETSKMTQSGHRCECRASLGNPGTIPKHLTQPVTACASRAKRSNVNIKPRTAGTATLTKSFTARCCSSPFPQRVLGCATGSNRREPRFPPAKVIA
jgi:hypothetical protein